MQVNVIEVITGALVLGVAALFFVFASQSSYWKSNTGYTLEALFDRVDGLSSGSEVRVSGVKVGAVVGISLDPDHFLAKVVLSVADKMKIPTDSLAEIVGDGLFGPKYLSIVPGGSERPLNPGERIKKTQAAVSLEGLIGKFLFQSNHDKDQDKPSQKK